MQGLSNIIPARDGKKPIQNGDSSEQTDSKTNSLTDDVFVKSIDSSPKRSRDNYSRDSRDPRDSRQPHRRTYAYDDLREPHRRSHDPYRAYDPHRKNRDRHRDQPMYDSRRSARDVSPQGRRSRQDGYNGSYERNGR